VYEFNIEIILTGVLLKAGMRLGLCIKATDRDAKARDFLDNHAYGHLWRETTFMSGGTIPPMNPAH
jgi:hypothetical protein